MSVKIGENIKRLRKENDITQETLAEYLNISYQAVSKWENGSASPDINLLPAIANFFSVSMDTLFGMEKQAESVKINEVIQKHIVFSAKGDLDSSEKLLREALKEFPRNCELITALMHTLFLRFCYHQDEKELLPEIIKKGELVLHECTEEKYRYSAIQSLTYCYLWLKQNDKAEEMALKLPSNMTSTELLASVYDGEKQVRQQQQVIIYSLEKMNLALMGLSHHCEMEKKYEDALYYLHTANKLYEELFEKKDYYFYHCRLKENYFGMCRISILQGKLEKALEYLKAAVQHTLAYDTLPQEAPYTSRCFNRHKHDYYTISKNHKESASELLVKELLQKTFDPVRENEIFIKLLKSLQVEK